MIRDRLVCGVNHRKIQQRLLSEGRTLTFEKAQEIALSIEAAERDSSEISTNTQAIEKNIEATKSEHFNEINKMAEDNARKSNSNN